jgi:hypothetical protein
MPKLYEHKFALPNGSRVFVPTAESIELGEHLCGWVAKRWRPPSYYFHLMEGGHIAATRRHLNHRAFLRLDLETFYDRVTRTKVVRGLRSIGYRHRDALELATLSTVVKSPGGPRSLPFGFVQSPLLATLALSISAVGRELARIEKTDVGVSVYMDDIILSAEDETPLNACLDSLEQASILSGFRFNERKKQGPSEAITAFNIWIRHRHMEITSERMSLFRQLMLEGNDAQAIGVLSYVEAINLTQANELRALRPLL